MIPLIYRFQLFIEIFLFSTRSKCLVCPCEEDVLDVCLVLVYRRTFRGDVEAAPVLVGDENIVGGIQNGLCACAVVVLAITF